MNSKNKTKAFVFLGVAFVLLITLTDCKQTSGGGGGGKQGAPFVEGGASLILSPNKLTIKVKVVTADKSAVTVEGCAETTLANDTETELHAKGTTVILKGKITKLYCNGTYKNKQSLTELNVQGLTSLKELNCSYNELPELNVQGCASLQELYCYSNKLNAQAMKEILNALPAREASDDAKAALYTEKTGATEGNCKDYTQPEDLKKAFDEAKGRNWKLRKIGASGSWEYL